MVSHDLFPTKPDWDCLKHQLQYNADLSDLESHDSMTPFCIKSMLVPRPGGYVGQSVIYCQLCCLIWCSHMTCQHVQFHLVPILVLNLFFFSLWHTFIIHRTTTSPEINWFCVGFSWSCNIISRSTEDLHCTHREVISVFRRINRISVVVTNLFPQVLKLLHRLRHR